MFKKIIENVREKTPLVHFITNYVTVTDVANALLACGGSPIMSDDENDVEDITSVCNALVINIGTLNERTIKSMIKAGKKANELNHPVVLDPVGAGASKLRTQTTTKLLKEIKFSVIKGNISEIRTVYAGYGTTKGVDADATDAVNENNLDEVIAFAKKLSGRTGAIIAITGAIDIVANSETAFVIKNGNAVMSKITGSGCMLAGVVAAYAYANIENILEATVCAISGFGLAGELAVQKQELENKKGTGTFRTYLIDEISLMDYDKFMKGMKIEKK